ncbi:PLC-like phosphodiesterase [Fistulina hepatica ATCC 64428]|uniref:PLC-like phosphodiesterase n=1 Tax=Fistulina hepatica ATCC 64428 TaxID=1128425 RepID=A0A0D7AI13_9AGAR|nr:PLC-like phosphodiesterase [Fistulina hepatica ATCC 64428]
MSTFTRATTCNGYADLCSRSYGNTTFFGSHDSYAVDTDPLDLSRDQEVDITTQLDLGVRLLQAEAHLWEDELYFCHTIDYLTTVLSWLDDNTEEVLTLLFTNPDSVALDIWSAAFEDAGIVDLLYVPSTVPVLRADWPTLGELIDDGTRVVMFMDYGADTSEVDYILPEFEMIWETPYDVTDASFPCSVNRIDTDYSTVEEHMYMINHFLDVDILGILIPDYDAASTTNSETSIVANANGCVPYSGVDSWPSFVLMDWVDIGDGQEAVDYLNGISS